MLTSRRRWNDRQNSFKRWRTVGVASVVLTSVFSTGLSLTSSHAAIPGNMSQSDEAVELLSQRLALAEDVAKSKWNNGSQIHDPERAESVLRSAVNQARENNLDEIYIRNVFQDQIAASESVQYSLFSHWSLDRGTNPPVGDIDSVRVKLTDLTDDIINSLKKINREGTGKGQCSVEIAAATERKIQINQWHDGRGDALRFATERVCF